MTRLSPVKRVFLGLGLGAGLLLRVNFARADMISPVTPYEDWRYGEQRTQQDKLPEVVVGGTIVLVVMAGSFIALSKVKKKNVP